MTTGIDTTAIQAQLLKIERLGANRLAAMAFVKDKIESLDKDNKEAKAELVKLFAAPHDITLAVATANALLTGIKGADDTLRKRLERRRSIMVKCLSQAYSDYDYTVTKGRTGGTIVPELVGDIHTRKAQAMLADYEVLCGLVAGLPTIDKAQLVVAIKAQAETPHQSLQAETQALPSIGVDVSMLAEIAQKAQDMINQAQASTTAKASKASRPVKAQAFDMDLTATA